MSDRLHSRATSPFLLAAFMLAAHMPWSGSQIHPAGAYDFSRVNIINTQVHRTFRMPAFTGSRLAPTQPQMTMHTAQGQRILGHAR